MFNSKIRWMWALIIIIGILAITALGISATANSSGTGGINTLYSLRSSGSSSVYPIWNAAQKKIMEEFNVKLEISSTGSGNGVRDAYEKKSDFGNASRDPKVKEVKAAGNKWNHIRTVKLATDAIVMYVKIPTSCSDTTFTTTPDKIVKAYTGLADDDLDNIKNQSGNIVIQNGVIKRGTVEITIPKTVPLLSDLLNTQCNEKIELFTRNTTASGTRDAFLKIADKTVQSNLEWLDDDLFSEILEVRLQKTALSSTNEANSAAQQAVKAATAAASYISFGFVKDRTNIVKSNREIIAGIKFDSKQQAIVPNVTTIQNKTYKWSRNLNTLINTESKNINKIIEILDFFCVSYSGREIIRKLGFLPVTKKEIIVNYKMPDVVLKGLEPAKVPWIE